MEWFLLLRKKNILGEACIKKQCQEEGLKMAEEKDMKIISPQMHQKYSCMGKKLLQITY